MYLLQESSPVEQPASTSNTPSREKAISKASLPSLHEHADDSDDGSQDYSYDPFSLQDDTLGVAEMNSGHEDDFYLGGIMVNEASYANWTRVLTESDFNSVSITVYAKQGRWDRAELNVDGTVNHLMYAPIYMLVCAVPCLHSIHEHVECVSFSSKSRNSRAYIRRCFISCATACHECIIHSQYLVPLQ